MPGGGETVESVGLSVGPGIVRRFPEVDTLDRVVYLPDADGFQVITDDQFYPTHLLHRHAESWIDEDDRSHINTEDARVAIDPR